MTGQAVFDQLVAFADQNGIVKQSITISDYEQWKRDYIWEALHGIRYGQSFCNHFGIKDNYLYFAPGDLSWCDTYIRKHYIERTGI